MIHVDNASIADHLHHLWILESPGHNEQNICLEVIGYSGCQILTEELCKCSFVGRAFQEESVVENTGFSRYLVSSN